MFEEAAREQFPDSALNNIYKKGKNMWWINTAAIFKSDNGIRLLQPTKQMWSNTAKQVWYAFSVMDVGYSSKHQHPRKDNKLLFPACWWSLDGQWSQKQWAVEVSHCTHAVPQPVLLVSCLIFTWNICFVD
jgi:hypothetical protein